VAVDWASLDDEQADALDLPEDCDGEGGVEWRPLLAQSKVRPHERHEFNELAEHRAATHLRLRIFPDGGIARLRAYGFVTERP
jgi:allantoicase